MNYRISRMANRDIERICESIAEDNPDAADRLDEQLHDAIQLLADFPGLGHKRADVTDDRYLFRAVGNYIVACRFEKDELLVVRVLHGRRDFRKLFGRTE